MTKPEVSKMKAFKRCLLATVVTLMVVGKVHATTPAPVTYINEAVGGVFFSLSGESTGCTGSNGNQFFVPVGASNFSNLLSMIEISFTTGRLLNIVTYACDSSGNASVSDVDIR
jgi:hypothetical protein